MGHQSSNQKSDWKEEERMSSLIRKVCFQGHKKVRQRRKKKEKKELRKSEKEREERENYSSLLPFLFCSTHQPTFSTFSFFLFIPLFLFPSLWISLTHSHSLSLFPLPSQSWLHCSFGFVQFFQIENSSSSPFNSQKQADRFSLLFSLFLPLFRKKKRKKKKITGSDSFFSPSFVFVSPGM